jgi:hypothetical protein
MMETSPTRNHGGSERGTPARSVATLLGVYAALYLALVVAFHFASSPDAAAAVAPIVVTAGRAEPSADTNGSYAVEPAVQDGPDNAREFGEAIDTSRTYN